MQAAMVVTWTHPVVGREAKALAYGTEVSDYFSQRAGEGQCSEPELFLSEGGGGIWIVKGDIDALRQIHDRDDAQLLTMKGELLMEGFRLEFCAAGESAAETMLRYQSALAAIG